MKLVDGNSISLLKNGAAYFPALISAIDAAVTEVRVETYIFEDDRSGTAIAHSLSRAAQRGVAVRVLVDGFGSRHVPAAFFESMRRAGVMLLVFRPERGQFQIRKSRLRRVHRKIVLIDHATAFVGGINFIDDFNHNLSTAHPRYDYAVSVQGPVVTEIEASMRHIWRNVSWAALKRTREERLSVARQAMLKPQAIAGGAALAFVARDNFRHRRDIERAYLAAIVGARHEVLIMSPYFLPGRRFRRALIRAAKRGVKVRVLLQGPADHPLLQWATRALYPGLLAASVRLYEYQASMLHGKVAVIDGQWATVGSSNLDPFSLILNREANIVAVNQEFAATLKQSVEAEIAANARQLDADYWCRISRWDRLKAWAAFGLSRVMAGMVGVRAD